MVAGASRMSNLTIKRQPVHHQKRKCTRADPTQTHILLNSYESQPRPNAAQFANISQETNLYSIQNALDCPFSSIFISQVSPVDQKVVPTEKKGRQQEQGSFPYYTNICGKRSPGSRFSSNWTPSLNILEYRSIPCCRFYESLSLCWVHAKDLRSPWPLVRQP